MRADLHIHSRYSDGGRWPAELARQASEAGLEAACVTDHDTLGGYPEFEAAARALGLRTWPAVEIDCVDAETSYKSEILAYFPDGRYAGTEAFLAASRVERSKRLAGLFERAGRLFGLASLDFEAVAERRMAGRPGGAPELASLRFSKTDLFIELRDRGAIPASSSYREFKKAYFDTGLFSDVRFEKPGLGLVSDIVARDGGVLVVPHIGHEFGDSLGTMRAEAERLDRLLERFRALGAEGVELYDYRTPEGRGINELVAERSARLGYFHTYGSDCHGPGSSKHGLGSFYGDFNGFPGPRERGKD
ncbi:MAG: PHP domain-containing protein [Spirochaetes bacterium]|nr:PHP domain-containing protein [Spirochaetota bacterium]MBU1081571.1 PHP domain-containing protein [Spirochaetota bacterium]